MFKAIIYRSDAEHRDISLFLNLSEHQASRSGIETCDFITHLLELLTVEIADLILREPADIIDDFHNNKSILLARYRLSCVAYSRKFTKHQRNQGCP